jgi:hypothetical protein
MNWIASLIVAVLAAVAIGTPAMVRYRLRAKRSHAAADEFLRAGEPESQDPYSAAESAINHSTWMLPGGF